MTEITVRPLGAEPETISALAHLLVDTVAAGGSVSFMHPLDPTEARGFWMRSLTAAERGERVVFGAFDGDDLVSTLTLLLDCPPNQPHRAEFAKMMTRPSHRGRGLASALIRAAEAEATERGRWMITLDTASDEGAAGLYEKHGFTLAGEIPDYALKPHGGLTGTLLYWKRLGAVPAA
jgi:ribosomal protein S18 acetylase RimI-like enzyme